MLDVQDGLPKSWFCMVDDDNADAVRVIPIDLMANYYIGNSLIQMITQSAKLENRAV